ncbi:cell surface protein SprA [Pedobacter sp.]|uniref:T9SS outer membrane translocon Sov/SprA n=1 Tax=Pedobacter sp. TaxID=1411316 RepID=UPI003D7F25C5
MRNVSLLITFLVILFQGQQAFSQEGSTVAPDSLKNTFGWKERQDLGFRLGQREVEYDAPSRLYILRERSEGRYLSAPQYLTVDEYQRLLNAEMKRQNWRQYSNAEISQIRETGIIPSLEVNDRSFERLFGGNTISIKPRGEAELVFLGRVNRNENPLLNERQRKQSSFDFDQRIQMDLVGQVGTKLQVKMNYNTEAQFDFENQFKLEYTGSEDEIIKKIEAGYVNFPLNTSLMTGMQSLFGVKTQLQFGRLSVTSVYSQQKSQSREIRINNGAQHNEFRFGADQYEANKHYFLAQYFREHYNQALAKAPIITTGINVTKIEVWVTNKSGATQDSRDVLALLDLGENNPYANNLVQGGAGYSSMPSGFNSPAFPRVSNDLLTQLPADARLSNSNAAISFFQANGGTDNFARLSYARKLSDREFRFHAQLGYISLNNALNADEVLAVAFRYTYNGVEYQVGELSTDTPFDPLVPKVLFAKLLKNETIKTYLPTWNLMMKNIYSIGGYQISPQQFKLDIYRIDEKTGVEQAFIAEGEKIDAETKTPLKNKPWLQATRLDRLNQQRENSADGMFDFESENNPFSGGGNVDANAGLTEFTTLGKSGYVTIDAQQGSLIFPVLEPFGKDLASQFYAAEQNLIDKYTYQALYDSTKVVAQTQFIAKNRYILKGSFQSSNTNEYSLNAINVAEGSVRVFAGTLPLQEGLDYTVNYMNGSVKILNESLLQTAQPIRISTENNELFGQQQRSLFGTRLEYRLNNHLYLGATLMNLSEKPITPKVNLGEEPIANTMWGMDLNYSAPSRFLTKMVDKLPFLSTREPSSITFSGEFARLIPGHPKALNANGTTAGTSYLDDFEAARSVIDLKSALSWQLSGTPQLFSESQLVDNLAYGYNRSLIAFYNIDPTFYYGNTANLPESLRQNRTERSNHYVREVLEQEVFPFKDLGAGQALALPTLDIAYYPTVRGPYNFNTTGFNPDGSWVNPRSKWGGLLRRMENNDFEAQNIEYIELWVLDPFLYKPAATGGDLYFNIGNLSEDILKDGRKALENGLPVDGDPSRFEETNWGRVSKLQPAVATFDNNPVSRKVQDVGLDGLSNADEKVKFATPLQQILGKLLPAAAAALESDPSSDDYVYFRGTAMDQRNAGILQRYQRYNGMEGNSRTPSQSMQDFGVENSAATALPDGEDVNRDNNMTQSDEYFQYKISMRPADLVVGKKYVTDKVTSQVKLSNGQTQSVNWYQIRIPLSEYDQRVGGIQDFKSIRFIRLFMTNFEDTTVLRFAKIQLVKGEWRQYNNANEASKVIADPSLPAINADHSTLQVATINIEENGKRTPIPYVLPPGIERERDYSNYRTETIQNEQSLTLTVKNLRDGYGRAAFRTAINDFRAYKNLEMYIHLEAEGNNVLNDRDLNAFLRIGTDNQDNYYEYVQPLLVTRPGTASPYAIWPEENVMRIDLEVFQKAKLARNAAMMPNGQLWPQNIPFEYRDGANTVIVKGQPDMSKIRVYMLGIKNPLRNPAAQAGDDGLDKHAQVWFNELRLTEFDERGGWAATARVNARLADFADVNLSGSKSTIGFGSIENRVSERNRADHVFFDLSSSMELGKFFPAKSGVKIPLFLSYSNQVSTPQYDPLIPDVELKNALANKTDQEKESILNYAQDHTTRNSISLTNVRKERTNPDKKPQLWDVENLSASYAYSNVEHRDFINQNNIQRNYRGSLNYTYSAPPVMISPFEKLIKSNTLALLRDVNFSLLPSAINFRIELDRYYAENSLRDNNPSNGIPINTTFNKNFLVTRVYGISWNLTRSFLLDFDATNYSIIDEPDGRINGLKRDTVWQNLQRLGRTTDYAHNLNLTYNLPINKIPGLDWINVATRYGTTFNWQTESQVTRLDPQVDLGNTVQNSRTIQVNPTLNLSSFYSQLGLQGSHDNTGVGQILSDLLTGVKTVNGAFTQTKGIFLPGYLPRTQYFGIDEATGAPGLGFVFGSQRDIRMMAINNGWITTDTLQSQLYINTIREDFSFTSTLEPIRDLRITLTANKNRTLNYSSNFRYNNQSESFDNLSPNTTGDYSVTFMTLRTAFSDQKGSLVSQVFQKFMANRQVISQRLGVLNPNSAGSLDGYADGYQKEAQDVVIAAFLAAYTGKEAGSSSLSGMPNIPLPNWRISYGGLSRIAFLQEHFKSIDLRHGYRSVYSVNGFNSLQKYTETAGAVSSRDVNNNFLPALQYSQVTIAEQFSPLVGVDTRLKNNMTLNFEMGRTRLLGLSMANSQLAQLSENNMVFGVGYRSNKFRFPFGMFKQLKLDNNMDIKMDVAVRDNKTVIYRADIEAAEVSAGAKNITLRPSVDYVLNKLFNVKVFYDSNITQPYTSQTFNTSYSNFGFSLRMIFN